MNESPDFHRQTSRKLIVPALANGRVLLCEEGLSFWGGVDPENGEIIDAHHPQHGENLAGRVVMMPTSRGSCTGSGVLLELAMNGHAPAALIFREDEDVLTLGALVATQMFDCSVAVIRLDAHDYDLVATKRKIQITNEHLTADEMSIELQQISATDIDLSDQDRTMLEGNEGAATQLAMEMLCSIAASQNAEAFLDVTRAHIDGCIYASPANLVFAEKMVSLGGRVKIPTTMNAISVDRENWQSQHVPPDFGIPASRLADAYVKMGAKPTFTCAPYQADDRPSLGEDIGWSESNAVVYANSVLGARTVKHPDFLDLFIALTGRAPKSGVYLQENRRAEMVIHVDAPRDYDDAFWPMLGWLSGQKAPDRIPLLTGLENENPNTDGLRAVCAAFGTTSAAPMLHIAGITPEADQLPKDGAQSEYISKADLQNLWQIFNANASTIDLVALGSPHFSLEETRAFVKLLGEQKTNPNTETIITLGRDVKKEAREEGLLDTLVKAGVKVISDICWCSISEPVFPPNAKTVMTNSGKYAHYGPGLSGRSVRFGSLAQCAKAAITGTANNARPKWLD